MKWKRTPYDEWVSRPFFIRRSEGVYSLYRNDGTDWGKLVMAGLSSLAAAKAAAEEAARE